MNTRRLLTSLFLLGALALTVLILPGLVTPAAVGCFFDRAAAQEDNPCLAQEVTISAQEAMILRAQGTANALEVMALRLQMTVDAQARQLELMRTAMPLSDTVSAFAAEAEAEATVLPFDDLTPTPPPFVTQLAIVRVQDAGSFGTEAVEIRNDGPVVDLSGWSLIDQHGHVYRFGELRLFSGASLTVFTRTGDDTPAAVFWGLTEPVWSSGETAALLDASGRVQSTFTLP
jgi:hypothetical protein